jgi:hypothetical protein
MKQVNKKTFILQLLIVTLASVTIFLGYILIK